MSGYFGFGVIPGGTVRGSVLGSHGFFGPVFVPAKKAGKTWANVLTGFENAGAFQKILFANAQWVIGGFHTATPTFALTSPTGLAGNWSQNNLPAAANNHVVTGLAFGAGVYVIGAALGGAAGLVFSSPDAITWTQRATAFAANSAPQVAFGNAIFVAIDVGATNHYETSPDGITWTAQAAFAPTSWNGQLIFDGTQFVVGAVVGGVNVVASSLDGINWVTHALTIAGTIGGLGFDGVGYSIGNFTDDTGVHGATLATLNTAISFNDAGLPTQAIATGGGSWARIDDNGTDPAAVSSANGSVWTKDTTAVGGVSMGSIAFGQGKFIACGSGPGANQGGIMTRTP